MESLGKGQGGFDEGGNNEKKKKKKSQDAYDSSIARIVNFRLGYTQKIRPEGTYGVADRRWGGGVEKPKKSNWGLGGGRRKQRVSVAESGRIGELAVV